MIATQINQSLPSFVKAPPRSYQVPTMQPIQKSRIIVPIFKIKTPLKEAVRKANSESIFHKPIRYPSIYTRNQAVLPQKSQMETYTGSGSAEQTTPLVHGGDERRETTLRVMVAIDESEWSFQALTWALDHLFLNAPSTVEGGEGMVTLVHVTQPFQPYLYPVGPGGAVYYPPTSVMESVKKAQEETSAAILSRALQICKDRMVKAEALHLTGDPKEMICEATEKMHIDLVVVGNRGLGMFKREFLGSVSNYCAHHAACPVMIVRPPRGSGSRVSASSPK